LATRIFWNMHTSSEVVARWMPHAERRLSVSPH
jgi:hypothetical protein